MAYETINISDISDIGATIPNGKGYILRINEVKALKASAKGHPMFIADYEVVSGEYEGFTVGDLTVLNVTRKNGKVYASGIMKWKRQLAAVGKPLGPDFPFPADSEVASGIIYKALKGLKLKANVDSDVVTKTVDGKEVVKEYKRVEIMGVARGVVEEVEDFEEFDGADIDDFVTV